MSIFYIKQGDTSPSLTTTLKDSSSNVVNVVGASIRLRLFTQDKSTQIVDGTMVKVDPENGIVRYVWNSGDTDEAGWFWAEFEVTFSDGSVETFPNWGYEAIKITPQL
jgi:hypothetical protein